MWTALHFFFFPSMVTSEIRAIYWAVCSHIYKCMYINMQTCFQVLWSLVLFLQVYTTVTTFHNFFFIKSWYLVTQVLLFPLQEHPTLLWACFPSYKKHWYIIWEGINIFMRLSFQFHSKSFMFSLISFRLPYRRRQWQLTPVLLPGKSHGWRSLVGGSPWVR